MAGASNLPTESDLMQQMLNEMTMIKRLRESPKNGIDNVVNYCKVHMDGEKKRRGKSAILKNPIEIRTQHKLGVAQNAELKHHSNIFWHNTVSHRIQASKKAFNQLRRVSIADLKLELSALGSYVILRVIEKGYSLTGWHTVVEDHSNEVCGFSVYNYPSNELFAVGTVVIVKEPYFKIAASGDSFIRCDCPTDIIVLKESHPLYYLTDEIDWIHDLDEFEEDLVMKFPVPKSAEGWRDRGNTLYKKLDFVSAREAYLLGLKKCKDKNSTWKFLKLIIADVFLKLGYYESAISACAEVLVQSPDDKSALFRAGKAHYNLRQYNDAYNYFEKIYKLFPNDSEGKRELEKTTIRLEEQKGNVNIARLVELSKAGILNKLECADYIGPLKIVEISGKGRGVVLTKDVEKDTLLIVSKAFASVLNPLEVIGMELFTNDTIDNKSNAVVVAEMSEMLMKNPKTYSPLIFDLSTGTNPRKEVQFFCDTNTKQESICDVEVLKDIFRCNAFATFIPDSDGIHSYLSGAALHIFPSYINHSCNPNIDVQNLNDLILCYSANKLKVGEEIEISYFPIGASYKERLEVLTKRGFTCHCNRCKRRI
ncbi:hypothetical protein CHUAL_006893 [Chamberlinius hualienensis]